MSSLRWHSAIVAIALAGACRCGGDGETALARVRSASGEVERNPDAGKPWTAAAAGDSIYLGGAVRTGASSAAVVELTEGGALRLGELSLIRFARSETEAFELAVEAGEAEIETGSVDILLATGAGIARLGPGTTARAERGEAGLTLEVIVGTAEIERQGEASYTVEVGRAVIVTDDGIDVATPDAGAPDAGPAPDASGAPPVALPRGAIVNEPATEADLELPAGESATIHVARPPVAVRVSFAETCPQGGLVETSRRKRFRRPKQAVFGPDSAIVTLPRGARHYRVRCAKDGAIAEDSSAEGKLRVVRDRSRTPIPDTPPKNDVEADGRHYIVLYQNAKPKIEFHWRRARASERGYVLQVEDRRGRVEKFRGDTASITVAPGRLREGRYKWWIETAGPGAARSRVSTLEIEFDNAAPTAHIRKPAPQQAWKSDSIRVEGTVLRGSEVSAEGKPIALDRHHRFSAAVTPAGDGRAIAIRIAHPRGGVHYYVRRRQP